MKKIIWIPLLLAAAATGIIIALPFAIEHLAERWLRDQAVPKPAIEDVDFNPFTGLLRIESATFSDSGGERGELDLLELDLEWRALLSGRLELARLMISGARIDVLKLDDGRVRIGGLTLPFAETAPFEAEAGEPWGLGLTDLSLDGIELTYRDRLFDSRLVMSRLTLDRIATWEPERTTELSADLELDGAPIALKIESTPLAREPAAEIGLQLERFALGSHPAVLEAASLQRAEGQLSLDLSSNSRYRQDGALLVEISGKAALDEAQIELPPMAASGTRFEWSGNLEATLPAGPTPEIGLSGDGALTVVEFALRQGGRPMKLAAFERLDLRDLTVHDLDRLEIGRLELAALEILRGDDAQTAVGSIGRIALVGSEFAAGTTLNIEGASLEDLIVDLERSAEGRIEVVSEILSDFAPATMPADDVDTPPTEIAAAETESSSAPPAIRLATLEIGGDSRVRFVDNAVSPPLSTAFSIKSLRLTGIDTGQPEQPMHVAFDIAQQDGATLSGEGDLRPFGEQLVSDFEFELERLDLTQLSSYLPTYNIQRGRLDLDATAKIRGETLDVANSVVIEKLKLAGSAADGQSPLAEGMAMPLDVALDLLRDGDDKIKLDLPISGSLSDPQFGTGDIVRAAMQKALQNAALAYAKNALQPLGTILLIGKLAGKAARPRFEPLTFAPGQTALTPEASAYLDKIGEMLTERQGLSLTFCGVSTVADRDYLISMIQPPDAPVGDASIAGASPGETAPESPAAQAQSPELPTEDGGATTGIEPAEAAAEAPPPTFEVERLELARQRDRAMQDYLVEKLGVEADRLFRCRPTLYPDPESPPRVEITL